MKKVLLFIIAIMAYQTKACIVYKDIKPDSIVKINPADVFGTAANIDLNGDANDDFIFLWLAFPGGGWNVSIIPADTSIRLIATGNDTVSMGARICAPLTATTVIGSSANWATSENGVSIVDSVKRNFAGLGDRYIGVRMTSNGKYYYGWILVAYDSVGGYRRVVVKSHAMQNTAGVPINAGDTGAVINSIVVYGTGGVNTVLKTATLQMVAATNPTGIINQGIAWKVNDTNIATITAAGLLKPKNTGKIKVTVTDSCSGKQDDTTITITLFKTGIENVPVVSEVIVYPNPASDILYIESKEGILYDKAILRSYDGRVVHNYILTKSTYSIDIRDLPSGMYYLQCVNTATQKQHVLRVQKQ